jgi:hypothetical protein
VELLSDRNTALGLEYDNQAGVTYLEGINGLGEKKLPKRNTITQ